MKILIIYNSKYGSSKKYAFILGKKLNGDIIDFKNISKKILGKYELIIFNSGIYEEKIRGLKKFFSYSDYFKGKRIIICATGIERRSSKKYRDVKEKNEKLCSIEDFFYLMGSYTFKSLRIIDKLKMILFIISLIFKVPKSLEEKSFLQEAFGHINYYDEEGLVKILVKINK